MTPFKVFPIVMFLWISGSLVYGDGVSLGIIGTNELRTVGRTKHVFIQHSCVKAKSAVPNAMQYLLWTHERLVEFLQVDDFVLSRTERYRSKLYLVGNFGHRTFLDNHMRLDNYILGTGSPKVLEPELYPRMLSYRAVKSAFKFSLFKQDIGALRSFYSFFCELRGDPSLVSAFFSGLCLDEAGNSYNESGGRNNYADKESPLRIIDGMVTGIGLAVVGCLIAFLPVIFWGITRAHPRLSNWISIGGFSLMAGGLALFLVWEWFFLRPYMKAEEHHCYGEYRQAVRHDGENVARWTLS